MKTFRRGWYGESYRHYLASKGVRTNKTDAYLAVRWSPPRRRDAYGPMQSAIVEQQLARMRDNAALRGNYDAYRGLEQDEELVRRKLEEAELRAIPEMSGTEDMSNMTPEERKWHEVYREAARMVYNMDRRGTGLDRMEAIALLKSTGSTADNWETVSNKELVRALKELSDEYGAASTEKRELRRRLKELGEQKETLLWGDREVHGLLNTQNDVVFREEAVAFLNKMGYSGVESRSDAELRDVLKQYQSKVMSANRSRALEAGEERQLGDRTEGMSPLRKQQLYSLYNEFDGTQDIARKEEIIRQLEGRGDRAVANMLKRKLRGKLYAEEPVSERFEKAADVGNRVVGENTVAVRDATTEEARANARLQRGAGYIVRDAAGNITTPDRRLLSGLTSGITSREASKDAPSFVAAHGKRQEKEPVVKVVNVGAARVRNEGESMVRDVEKRRQEGTPVSEEEIAQVEKSMSAMGYPQSTIEAQKSNLRKGRSLFKRRGTLAERAPFFRSYMAKRG
jgi:hypothetical protein